MWKSGAQTSVRSSSARANACIALTLFQKMFPCVSIAPLGMPVVPEVYMSSATSSSRTG